MKEKTNVVQLSENQEKEVQSGLAAVGYPCYNPEYYPICRCRLSGFKCGRPQWYCP